MRRRRSLGHKGQLEMMDDPVHHGIVCEEGNDAHLASVLGAEQGVHLMDFSYHLCPAPAGIGIEAEVTDSDLTLVGNMGCDPGDEEHPAGVTPASTPPIPPASSNGTMGKIHECDRKT